MGVLTDAGMLGYLVEKILGSKLARTPRGAEVASVIGISLTTLIFGGVTSASILTFGPVLNEVGKAKGIHPYRRANLLDAVANSLPAIVPFLSVFVFIGSALTGLSPVAVAGRHALRLHAVRRYGGGGSPRVGAATSRARTARL